MSCGGESHTGQAGGQLTLACAVHSCSGDQGRPQHQRAWLLAFLTSNPNQNGSYCSSRNILSVFFLLLFFLSLFFGFLKQNSLFVCLL